MHHKHNNSARASLLAQRAAGMRSSPTWSEAALWRIIGGRRLGVQFRRQVVVGSFIVDFVAPREKLVVEVDGGYHAKRRAADERRDRVLGRMGYRVVRLRAKLVVQQPKKAEERVREALSLSPVLRVPP